MVSHSYYPDDPRVRREAEALRDKGYRVDIICLRDRDERRHEVINGIRVYRLPVKRHRGQGFIIYLAEYLTFFFYVIFKVTSLYLRNPYQIIQVHTIPDFLVFCSLVPWFFGSFVILDMHEVMPEFFGYRYRLRGNHPVMCLIKLTERFSTRYAHHIITVSDPLKEILISRQVPAEKITVIMNVADDRIFTPSRPRLGRVGTGFTLSYHGLLSDIYDLTEVIKATKDLKDKIKGLRLLIIGRGPEEANYKRLVKNLGLEEMVIFKGYLTQEETVKVLNETDVGIVPLKRVEFTNLAFPTKLVEYVALGIPVAVARRKTIQYYFAEDSLAFFQPDDLKSISECILRLYYHPEERLKLVNNAYECYKKIDWSVMKERYYKLIDRILD